MTEKEFREKSIHGNLYLLILQVGTPMALYGVFNAFFGLLDTFMASSVSSFSASTVAYILTIQNMINNISIGMILGSMVLVNKAYGAGDDEMVKRRVNTLFFLDICLAGIFLLLIIFAEPFLKLMQTPDEFIVEGKRYFIITVSAIIVNIFNQTFVYIEKSRGKTNLIMVVNIFSMVIKLALSAFFVFVLEAGIEMIALSTLITYLLVLIFAIYRLSDKNSLFSIRPRYIHYDKPLLGESVRLSAPISIEKSSFSFAKTIVNSQIIYYGNRIIGALGISNQASSIACSLQNGYSDAAVAIMSQNVGDRNWKRCTKCYVATLVTSLAASLVGVGILLAFSKPLVHVFALSRNGYDAEFEKMIMTIFQYDMLSCIPYAATGACVCLMMGLGKTGQVLFLSFFRAVVFRIPVMWYFINFTSLGYEAVGIMMIFSNGMSGVMSIFMALHLILKLRKRPDYN